MSEIISPNESRIRRFTEIHVHIPQDYEAYREEMVEQWRERAEAAWLKDEPIAPMWLRRNGESGAEFSAHIDYLIPMATEVRYLAAIDISDQYVQVWLPAEDGSGEPVVSLSEPYDDESLMRAIELVEATVLTPAE